MSWGANSKTVLRGFPLAWVHVIDETADSISELFRFDNLQSSTIKIPKEASSSTSTEYTEVNRADGVVIKYKKYNLSLSGETGEDITEAAQSSDATGKGEITLVTNEADLTSANWTTFLKQLRDKKDKLFMITIGTGVTSAAPARPDGYAIMIGKLTSDIESQLTNSPSSITMTFAAYMNSGLATADLDSTNTSLYTAIDWQLGGDGKNITGLKPAALTGTAYVSAESKGTGDIGDITRGEVALIAVTA